MGILRRITVVRTCLLLFIILATCLGVNARKNGAELRADPKDIKEIFAAIPWPKGETDSLADNISKKVRDAGHRRVLVDSIRNDKDNVLDTANGYLRLDLGDGDFVVCTYFQKANGDRLVVLQIGDANVPNDLPLTEDYLFTLSRSSFVTEAPMSILPPIRFEDFWGNQPLPKASVKRLIAPTPCYQIEWPRKGTIARAIYIEPYFDTEGKEELEAEKVAKRRQYDEIQLVWDKQKGQFGKGQPTLHKK